MPSSFPTFDEIKNMSKEEMTNQLMGLKENRERRMRFKPARMATLFQINSSRTHITMLKFGCFILEMM